MNERILAHIDNPVELEKLYRENNNEFKKQFNEIYPNYKDKIGLQVWNVRLNFESDKIALMVRESNRTALTVCVREWLGRRVLSDGY